MSLRVGRRGRKGYCAPPGGLRQWGVAGRESGRGLTLKLDLILNDEGLALVVDLLGELGRDGVVGGGVLDNKTLVTLHSLVDGGLLNSPLADVRPLLIILGVLLGVGRLPPLLPVIGELFQEGSLELGRL